MLSFLMLLLLCSFIGSSRADALFATPAHVTAAVTVTLALLTINAFPVVAVVVPTLVSAIMRTNLSLAILSLSCKHAALYLA